MLRFIRLTDTKQIQFRIPLGRSEKEREKAITHLSNFYAIANQNEGKLLRAQDSGEIILFNPEKNRIGVSGYNIPCKLRLDASPKEIRKAVRNFRRMYENRN